MDNINTKMIDLENPGTTYKILTLDIGGTTIKATVLDQHGNLFYDYRKAKTPRHPTPEKVVKTIQKLIIDFPGYDRISAGFPGYVKKGTVFTAPNLGTEVWRGFNLKKYLGDVLGKPVRLVNDADMQGLGVVSGKGFEMVITLGTGFGTALLQDGHLLPHLELAHHSVTKNKTYDDYIGDHELKRIGEQKWNKRMKGILGMLKTVFNFDTLYIGGGNSSKLNFKLDRNMRIITNQEGIKGGARLWQLDEDLFMKTKTHLA